MHSKLKHALSQLIENNEHKAEDVAPMFYFEPHKNALKGQKFIDLFAGIGGFRMAMESFRAECVFSSEWDKHAQKTYYANFGEMPEGDITEIKEEDVPA